jgi:hypothetical protein
MSAYRQHYFHPPYQKPKGGLWASLTLGAIAGVLLALLVIALIEQSSHGAAPVVQPQATPVLDTPALSDARVEGFLAGFAAGIEQCGASQPRLSHPLSAAR